MTAVSSSSTRFPVTLTRLIHSLTTKVLRIVRKTHNQDVNFSQKPVISVQMTFRICEIKRKQLLILSQSNKSHRWH